MQKINFEEFTRVELRAGKIIDIKEFPEARKPAYILYVDFGEKIGVRKSSVQITEHYSADELKGKQVVGVVNFPPKQIGPVKSECLITGFPDENGHVVLCVPDKKVPLGSKLF